ncbi:MAG: urease accessory protein UreD, partial [Candidatus Rokubacteria bacterium]|nr:urease accessory protein UreD [Candidatus Rokubacteria bacterium]
LALADPAAIVSILNPTGGLLGGDRLEIDVTVGARAHACLTTPSATKVYRTGGVPAGQRATVRVGCDGILEWIPDHTIPFAGAAVRQSLEVELAAGARAVVVDAWAAGRVARGEAWRFALVDSALAVRDAAGPLVLDRFVLQAGGGAGLGLAEGFSYFFTMVVAGGGDLAGFAEEARDVVAGREGLAAGVGQAARRARVTRGLARSAPVMLEAIDALWGCARRRVLGVPALALRKP